jgi:FtsZ-binding cell division protein ZapB
MNRKTDWKLRIGVMMKGAGLLVPVLVLLSAQGPASVRAAGLSLADQVERPVREAIDIRRKTQRDKERWRDEKQKRIALYERLQQAQTALNARQEQLNEERKALQARIADKTGQLARIEEISGQIRPFLDEVMDRLGRFYAGDTPFLKAERQRRMDHLVRVMAEPDVAVSEKFRKIMEALTVEADYGRTIEVYRDTVEVQGRATLVDIFRLGRIALFYQTLDGRGCGFYNVAENAWQPLPGKYRKVVQAAVEMGAKRRPVEILSLPVGRLDVR